MINIVAEFSIFFNYVKNLKFTERPDYFYLKALFYDLLILNYSDKDFYYDWMTPKPQIDRRKDQNLKTTKIKKSPERSSLLKKKKGYGLEDDFKLYNINSYQKNDAPDKYGSDEEEYEENTLNDSERTEPFSIDGEKILQEAQDIINKDVSVQPQNRTSTTSKYFY